MPHLPKQKNLANFFQVSTQFVVIFQHYLYKAEDKRTVTIK